MASARLNVTVYVKANASGNATAKVGPLSSREVWHPGQVTVGLAPGQATPTNEAGCAVSIGDSQTKVVIDSCVDGSSGDTTDAVSSSSVHCGEYVWADWTGGDPSVTFALTVTGTREV